MVEVCFTSQYLLKDKTTTFAMLCALPHRQRGYHLTSLSLHESLALVAHIRCLIRSKH